MTVTKQVVCSLQNGELAAFPSTSCKVSKCPSCGTLRARATEQQLRDAGIADEQSIQCRLPITPLSYHGKLITIRWSLRLRLFLVGGREILTERPFYVVACAHRDTRLLFSTAKELPARPMSNVVDWSNVVVPVGSVLRTPPVRGSSRADATFTAS
jgi:hypothetical protein